MAQLSKKEEKLIKQLAYRYVTFIAVCPYCGKIVNETEPMALGLMEDAKDSIDGAADRSYRSRQCSDCIKEQTPTDLEADIALPESVLAELVKILNNDITTNAFKSDLIDEEEFVLAAYQGYNQHDTIEGWLETEFTFDSFDPKKGPVIEGIDEKIPVKFEFKLSNGIILLSAASKRATPDRGLENHETDVFVPNLAVVKYLWNGSRFGDLSSEDRQLVFDLGSFFNLLDITPRTWSGVDYELRDELLRILPKPNKQASVNLGEDYEGFGGTE